MLKFIIATVKDFESVNIDVNDCRKSVDGLKALKHIENLTAEEMNNIRFKEEFEFVDVKNIYTLMNNDEWAIKEGVG